MDAYSTRTVQVHEKERELAQAWERRHGRAPTSRELLYIANDATLQSRKGKDAAQSTGTRWPRGGTPHSAASWRASRPRCRTRAARTQPHQQPAMARSPAAPPSREAQARAVQKALALVSDKQPAWTRHDLLKQLALVMPPETRRMSAQAAQELLLGLADEALSGRAGDVVCLEAPEWPPLPRSLRRELDGRSVYTRPGTARYATAAQLSREERLVAHAQTQRAPRLPSELAARRLGADAELLEAQLRETRAGRARAPHAQRAAAGPGRGCLARADLGPHRRGGDRPGRDGQDPGAGRRRAGVGRPGVRHRDLAERHQRAPQGRCPGHGEHHQAPGRPRQHPAGVADRGRRRVDGVPGPSGRAGGVRGAQWLQAGAGRRPGAAGRRGRRRRDDAAGGPARVRAAGRAGPVHRRLGTRGLAAAAPRGRHRAGRVRPARPDPRRPARTGHGPGGQRLRRQLPGRTGRAADGRGLGAVPGTVRTDPRRPDPPRPGRRQAERSGSPRTPKRRSET